MGSKGVNEGHANSRLRPRIKTLKPRREKLRRFIGLFTLWLIIIMLGKKFFQSSMRSTNSKSIAKYSFVEVKSTLKKRKRKECMDDILWNILFEKDEEEKVLCMLNFNK